MTRLDDKHYRSFASRLELLLERHEEVAPENLLSHQRAQIKTLVALETEFRETLIVHPWGNSVYKEFVRYICEEKTILAARPYFRERQTTFTKYISPALKDRNEKGLYRFKFNWSFIEYVLGIRKWGKGSKLVKIANKIAKLRMDILEQNLPLAISQARGFWNVTPRSHLTFMDILQIQCQGLLLAIDKFSPPKGKLSEKDSLAEYKKFRAVAIGIMTRDRVNEYSATMLHFYPKDKAKMYRANKFLRRYSGVPNWDDVATNINQELSGIPGCQTTPEEISSLLAAGSMMSGDVRPESTDGEGGTILENYASENSELFADTLADRHAILAVRKTSMQELSLFELKLLKMKGLKV